MTDAKVLLAIPGLFAAVCAALDAGVFYETDFKAACRPAWDANHPVHEQHLPDVTRSDDLAWDVRRAQYLDAVERAKAGPRGTWLVIISVSESGRQRYESLISDGMGGVQTRTDGWAAIPTFDAVVTRLVGYEIYTARKAVEEERRGAAAVARLRELGLHVGMTLRNVGVSHHRYSTAVVERADALTGHVTLLGTRRGSRNRFRIETTALGLEVQEPITAPTRAAPDYSQAHVAA